jgi:hypothetical protein
MFAAHPSGMIAETDFSFYRNKRIGAAACPAACVADGRFRQLLGGSRTITYLGEVTRYQTSFAGRVLAQLGRLIGGPVPLYADVGVAAAVTVTEDEAEGGQIWTRQYGRHRGFPQMIHSVKRFAGSTGLEEYLGFGFGIALRVRATDGALWFDSDHYFLKLGGRHIHLPRWLSPGALTIGHIDHGDGWFTFSFDLRHPLLGPLIVQQCRFTEATPGTIQ